MNNTYKNPIIPGFYPDPSIVRVEDDYYLVHSSFEYFPAIPIWHSKDLVHWKQIGNAIVDESQGLDLSDTLPSGGVQACTIRYHKGMFYITSTRVKKEWPGDYHFIISASNPRGPWSKCHFINDAPGIDSSLFFDEDKAYFLANREKDNAKDGGDTEIWISEIDLTTNQLIGPKIGLWDGTGGLFPEGPHLYKREGYYYLLIAEGGTLHNHTVTMARSKDVFGPYEPSVRNPLLTHKHLDRTYPIQNVGHADLVQTQHGDWYAVLLGSRPRGGFYDGGNTIYSFGGYYRNLGRETFMIPIIWPADKISPLLSPLSGKVELNYPFPNLKRHEIHDIPIELNKESLRIKWCHIKNNYPNKIELLKKNKIKYHILPSIEESFYGFRQTSWNVQLECDVNLEGLKEGDTFSLTAYLSEASYLELRVEKKTRYHIVFASHHKHQESIVKEVTLDSSLLHFGLRSNDQEYTFFIDDDDERYMQTMNGRVISCDLNDSHTGVFFGFTGTSASLSHVMIDQFHYESSR